MIVCSRSGASAFAALRRDNGAVFFEIWGRGVKTMDNGQWTMGEGGPVVGVGGRTGMKG
jgi:hypothetical protein